MRFLQQFGHSTADQGVGRRFTADETARPLSVRYGVALLAVAVATLLRLGLNLLWDERLPYLVFFPAVLVSALWGGLGPGLLALVLSALATAYFVLPPSYSLLVARSEDRTGLLGFCLVALMIALVGEGQRRVQSRANQSARQAQENARIAGESARQLREANQRLQESAEALAASEARQRTFLKDVLRGVTEGKLILCDREADLPPALALCAEPVSLSVATLKDFRHQVQQVALKHGFPRERLIDLLTAAGEASMNAVVHAGGGEGRVHACADLVQVWIQDRGTGIEMGSLHRATLERGYTTAGSLGHGFWLTLKTADRVYLLTGTLGTSVVVELSLAAQEASWLLEVEAL